MEKQSRTFFSGIIKQLNLGRRLRDFLPGVLEDLCVHFGFGSGFVYWADHTGLQTLYASYAAYGEAALTPMLDLHALLGQDMLAQLAQVQEVSFRAHSSKDDLAEKMAEIFGAHSMILVPMADTDGSLMGFTGMSDRRGESRLVEDDLTFAYLVLESVATNVRMRLYRHQREATRETLRSVLDNMGVDVYVKDYYTHEILYANRSMGIPYGGTENMLGKVCWEVLYRDQTEQCDFCPQKKLLDENGNPLKIYSWDYQRPWDGAWFRVLSAAFRWTDGRLAHIVSSIDISENKRNEEIIRQVAEYDYLTGLPNRYRWTNDCDVRVDLGDREGFLLFFDLDGFKAVNDKLGHKAGDTLLMRISDFLRGSSYTENNSYRHGGDEFVVMHMAGENGTVDDVCSYLISRFSQPWQLPEGNVMVGISIGVSHIPVDGVEPSKLLRMADKAMYEAKRAGGNAAWYYNRGRPCPASRYRRKDKR